MKRFLKLSLKSLAVLVGASLIYCAPGLSHTVSYATERGSHSSENEIETNPITVVYLGEKITYDSLIQAVNEAESGSTIQITDDVEIEEPIVIPDKKTLTITLDESSITANSNLPYAIKNNGNLRIKGKGSIIGPGIQNFNTLRLSPGSRNSIIIEATANDNHVAIWNEKTLNLHNCTIVSNDDLVALYNTANGRANIKKSTIELNSSEHCAIVTEGRLYLSTTDITNDYGIVQVLDGSTSISSGTYASESGHTISVLDGSVRINNGTLCQMSDDTSSYVVYVDGGACTINGGTFISGEEDDALVENLTCQSGSITINGGSFEKKYTTLDSINFPTNISVASSSNCYEYSIDYAPISATSTDELDFGYDEEYLSDLSDEAFDMLEEMDGNTEIYKVDLTDLDNSNYLDIEAMKENPGLLHPYVTHLDLSYKILVDEIEGDIIDVMGENVYSPDYISFVCAPYIVQYANKAENSSPIVWDGESEFELYDSDFYTGELDIRLPIPNVYAGKTVMVDVDGEELYAPVKTSGNSEKYIELTISGGTVTVNVSFKYVSEYILEVLPNVYTISETITVDEATAAETFLEAFEDFESNEDSILAMDLTDSIDVGLLVENELLTATDLISGVRMNIQLNDININNEKITYISYHMFPELVLEESDDDNETEKTLSISDLYVTKDFSVMLPVPNEYTKPRIHVQYITESENKKHGTQTVRTFEEVTDELNFVEVEECKHFSGNYSMFLINASAIAPEVTSAVTFTDTKQEAAATALLNNEAFTKTDSSESLFNAVQIDALITEGVISMDAEEVSIYMKPVLQDIKGTSEGETFTATDYIFEIKPFLRFTDVQSNVTEQKIDNKYLDGTTIELQLPIPESYTGNTVNVIHILSNGNEEKHSQLDVLGSDSARYVIVEIKEFSEFKVSLSEDPLDQDDNNKDDGIISGPGEYEPSDNSNDCEVSVSSTKKITPNIGEWKKDSAGWWYCYKDGTYPTSTWVSLEWNGKYDWYYFEATGYMHTGWLLDSNMWYFLSDISDGTLGHMVTGWKEINGKWYYFNPVFGGPMGSMLANTVTPDGYVVDETGAWIQ